MTGTDPSYETLQIQPESLKFGSIEGKSVICYVNTYPVNCRTKKPNSHYYYKICCGGLVLRHINPFVYHCVSWFSLAKEIIHIFFFSFQIFNMQLAAFILPLCYCFNSINFFKTV
jgi:hypothetical protein